MLQQILEAQIRRPNPIYLAPKIDDFGDEVVPQILSHKELAYMRILQCSCSDKPHHRNRKTEA